MAISDIQKPSFKAFKDFLANPETVLDRQRIGLDIKNLAGAHIYEECMDEVVQAFAPVMRSFMDKIFMRGLYPAILDSNDARMISNVRDLPFIATYNNLPKIEVMIGLDKDERDTNYIKFEYDVNTLTIGVTGFNGKLRTFERMIDKNSGLFEGGPYASAFMARDRGRPLSPPLGKMLLTIKAGD